MGLDFKDLELPEPLRAFYASGLTCLLQTAEEGPRTSAVLEPDPEPGQGVDPFPEPWQGMLQRLKPPVACVWTYWELASDLGSAASPERQALFRGIVRALQWPSGSLAFWPLSQESGQGLLPRTDCFWAGLDVIAPRCVVCFGADALEHLCSEPPQGYGFFSCSGRTFLYVPGPADMLPDNREVKAIVWNKLQEITFD